MGRFKTINIDYFVKDEKAFVKAANTPFKNEYLYAIRIVPTSKWNVEEKAWICEAKYGEMVEELIKKYYPDNPCVISGEELRKTITFVKKRTKNDIGNQELPPNAELRVYRNPYWCTDTRQCMVFRRGGCASKLKFSKDEFRSDWH